MCREQPQQTQVGLAQVQPEHDEVTVGVGGDDELGDEEGEERGDGQQDADTPHLQLISALCALSFGSFTAARKTNTAERRPNQTSISQICKEFI